MPRRRKSSPIVQGRVHTGIGAEAPLTRFLGLLRPTAPWPSRCGGVGWIEAESLVVEHALADCRRNRLSALANKLVDNGVELLPAG